MHENETKTAYYLRTLEEAEAAIKAALAKGEETLTLGESDKKVTIKAFSPNAFSIYYSAEALIYYNGFDDTRKAVSLLIRFSEALAYFD